MSTHGLGDGVAPPTPAHAVAAAQPHDDKHAASPPFLHSPPDSNNAPKSAGSDDDSELSDLDEEPVLPDADAPVDATPNLQAPPPAADDTETKPAAAPPADDEDIGEVLPDHWSGNVAVFRPTMHQFKDFNKFMDKVNSYGMKSGIIKIIPPKEWLDKQPPLDDMVKHVRVREPIKQDIMGSNGTYRQVNILHGRSYNVPQWRQLCDQSEHQPPARRGERRANADKPRAPRRQPAAPKPDDAEAPTPRKRAGGRGGRGKRGRGRPAKRGGATKEEERPMTPESPKPESNDKVVDSVEAKGADAEEMPSTATAKGRGGRTRQSKGGGAGAQSVSARRKYSRREGSAMIDEEAFKDFDYHMDISDFTPERCEELERAYWKTLTYAAPLYGADMMGSLFDDRTESWNLGKLPNILDVLGTKIPGVNCAYLYFGMWKATFAWHLEDVDLYSINYVHFGAPKQWYSISQADARRFEAAMRNIWPADAKACSQFLRHKGFLISPQHLQQHYGIKVNKVVSYPGEFVVTFPYGYHSGYNLGYNCAEAVNFALEPWLEMGKIAKRCECAQAQDSVWINVWEIERKLRGEETEYEETDDDEEEEDEEEEEASGLPSPSSSSQDAKVKFSSTAGRKRKRAPADDAKKVKKPKVKKIKLRLKSRAEPPCCLCPNDIASMELLPTDDGRRAHRVCALYLPETYIDVVEGEGDKADKKEVVCNAAGIHKDRTDLKCLFCRSKRGACFQCSQKKCARAYHATCAAAAGVFVEEGEVPVFAAPDDAAEGESEGEKGEKGAPVEYKEQAFEFSCRFHRAKRDKKLDGTALEDDERIRTAAAALDKGDVCQVQFARGDIFAGVVVENRAGEEALLLDVLPHGDRIETEYKWLLLPDPSDYHLPRASAKAIPLPASRKAKDKLNARRGATGERPRKDDHFVDGGYTWAEFHTVPDDELAGLPRIQQPVDLATPDKLWHYLATGSTDTKAQYTEDPAVRRANPRGNYLSTIPKPAKPPRPYVPRGPAPRKYVHTPTFPHAAYTSATFATQQGQAQSHPYQVYLQQQQQQRPAQAFTTHQFQVAQPQQPQQGQFATQQFQPQQQQQFQARPQPQQYQHQIQPAPQHQQIQPRPPQQQQAQAMPQQQQFQAQTAPQQQPAQPVPPQQHQQGQSMPQQHQFQTRPPQMYHFQTTPQQPQQQQYQAAPQQQPQAVSQQQQTQPSMPGYQQYPFTQAQFNRPAQYQPPEGARFVHSHQAAPRAQVSPSPNPQAQAQHPGSAPSPVPVPQNEPARQQQQQPTQKTQPLPPKTQAPQTQMQPPPAQQTQPPQRPVPTPQSAPAAKAFKNPPKQSPVPLPANFLAAMGGSAPSTPISRTPVSQSPRSAGSNGSGTRAPAPKPPVTTPHHQGGSVAGAMNAAPGEFPDVPGRESMEFMEKMMANLRRAVGGNQA